MSVVAITGANGLLGGNVAEAFAAAGWKVRALCRTSANVDHLMHLPLDWRHISYETGSLVRAFAGTSVVVHCAGVTIQSRRVRPEHRAGNIDLTRCVFEASHHAKIERIVHCSSAITCGFSAGRPVDEDEAAFSTPPWQDGYLISKQIAEREALQRNSPPDVIVVNPTYLLGPLDAKPSSGRLLLLVARGHAYGWPSGGNNFADVRDVAAGIVAAASRGRAGERYILGGENLSYRDLMTRAARAAGRRPPGFAIPYKLAAATGHFGELYEWISRRPTDVNGATVAYAYSNGLRYTSEKARRDLDYRTRPIDETLRDSIAWFRQRGNLTGSRQAG